MQKRYADHYAWISFALLVVFGIFAVIVSAQEFLYAHIIRFDYAVDSILHLLRGQPFVVRVMLGATYLGNPEVIIALEICLLAFIVLVHRKRIATLFLAGIIVGEIASLSFKYLIERERPLETLFQVARHGYSFPSGHALISMVFYGCLGFFAAHLAKTSFQKRIITLITCLIIFLVGISRVFLGVHWASDVVGGWILGGACLSAVIAAFYLIHHHVGGDRLRSLRTSEKLAVLVVACMVGFFLIFFFVTHVSEIRSIV